MALCNVQTLLDDAACFACLSPGVQQILELQLLCEILQVVNVPSCTQVFSGNGDPTGVVFPTCDTAFYIQKDSDPQGIIWPYYNGAWQSTSP